MARQPEAKLQLRIRKALLAEFGGWWVKVWGGPFQRKGTPDILGCVEGLFFALEAKMPKGKLSDIQRSTIRDIRKEGKGTAHVVFSPEQAVRIVRRRLAAAGVVSTGRSRDGAKRKDAGTVHGARDRKDLGSRRRHRAAGKPIIHWHRSRKSKQH